MVCENFADPFNIEAILDNVTDNDSFFCIYIVETPIDYSNDAEGDIDPLQLEVNDNNDADDNDDDEDDHDGLVDNANDNDSDSVSVSSDISLASTVVLDEAFFQDFLEDSTVDYYREN